MFILTTVVNVNTFNLKNHQVMNLKRPSRNDLQSIYLRVWQKKTSLGLIGLLADGCSQCATCGNSRTHHFSSSSSRVFQIIISTIFSQYELKICQVSTQYLLSIGFVSAQYLLNVSFNISLISAHLCLKKTF